MGKDCNNFSHILSIVCAVLFNIVLLIHDVKRLAFVLHQILITIENITLSINIFLLLN